ncbi:MAG TPA: alkaline phosphatase family protein [Candidatus Acidoferrum sp.]|jgi:predicted AlkP superfamily pyrophosphatase or phosphodiesterase|nr:alkaline phosphatase family protein [Candidatus Acidoferrum sp.]
MGLSQKLGSRVCRALGFATFGIALLASGAWTQGSRTAAAKKVEKPTRPKLVVLLVVDQMRGDYVDKFRGQWTGGLKRLLTEGAWFRAAAFPYAATETCPGHSSISTGSFPASHGMVANAWWDREQQKMVTCTSDPNAKNMAYAGGSTKGGDSAWRMEVPAFAEELKFQTAGNTGVVTFSLKARSAITLAGHKNADPDTRRTVLWFDDTTGAWVTSDQYGTTAFAEEYIKRHPVNADYDKTWSLALPRERYLYDEEATGAATVTGWAGTFPHPLRGKAANGAPDEAFYQQWEASPFADAYLTSMAKAAITALKLWNTGETDFLGISYSSLDLVGHRFGPRSWEIQDMLAQLDKDLGELFNHLDKEIGRGNYVVALSADHGVAPIPVDMQKTGVDAGVLSLPELQSRIEKALEPLNYTKPVVARMAGNEVYFSEGVYGRLKADPPAMKAVLDAISTMPGVAAVYRAEELDNGTTPIAQTRKAAVLSYFAGRSGDLYLLQKPYWLLDSSPEGSKRLTGTSHGTPYNYDQHVPVLFMGFGIQPGEYFEAATPADIAPTLAALTGVTLATRDGRVLAEALRKPAKKE